MSCGVPRSGNEQRAQQPSARGERQGQHSRNNASGRRTHALPRNALGRLLELLLRRLCPLSGRVNVARRIWGAKHTAGQPEAGGTRWLVRVGRCGPSDAPGEHSVDVDAVLPQLVRKVWHHMVESRFDARVCDKGKKVGASGVGCPWQQSHASRVPSGALHSMRPLLANSDMMELTRQILPWLLPMHGSSPARALGTCVAPVQWGKRVDGSFTVPHGSRATFLLEKPMQRTGASSPLRKSDTGQYFPREGRWPYTLPCSTRPLKHMAGRQLHERLLLSTTHSSLHVCHLTSSPHLQCQPRGRGAMRRLRWARECPALRGTRQRGTGGQ